MTIAIHGTDAFGRCLADWLASRGGSRPDPAEDVRVLASAALSWRSMDALGRRWTEEGVTWIPALADRDRLVVGPVFDPARDGGCFRCLRARYESAFADKAHARALDMLMREARDAEPCSAAWSPWSVSFAGASVLSLLDEPVRDGACVVADLGEVSVRRYRILPLHGCSCRRSKVRGTAALREAFENGVDR